MNGSEMCSKCARVRSSSVSVSSALPLLLRFEKCLPTIFLTPKARILTMLLYFCQNSCTRMIYYLAHRTLCWSKVRFVRCNQSGIRSGLYIAQVWLSFVWFIPNHSVLMKALVSNKRCCSAKILGKECLCARNVWKDEKRGRWSLTLIEPRQERSAKF